MPLGKLRPFFDIAGDNFLDKYKENDPGFFIGNRRERLERIGEKDDLSVIRDDGGVVFLHQQKKLGSLFFCHSLIIAEGIISAGGGEDYHDRVGIYNEAAASSSSLTMMVWLLKSCSLNWKYWAQYLEGP